MNGARCRRPDQKRFCFYFISLVRICWSYIIYNERNSTPRFDQVAVSGEPCKGTCSIERYSASSMRTFFRTNLLVAEDLYKETSNMLAPAKALFLMLESVWRCMKRDSCCAMLWFGNIPICCPIRPDRNHCQGAPTCHPMMRSMPAWLRPSSRWRTMVLCPEHAIQICSFCLKLQYTLLGLSYVIEIVLQHRRTSSNFLHNDLPPFEMSGAKHSSPPWPECFHLVVKPAQYNNISGSVSRGFEISRYLRRPWQALAVQEWRKIAFWLLSGVLWGA